MLRILCQLFHPNSHKGAIKRTYLSECKDLTKQIKKVFANDFKPEEKNSTDSMPNSNPSEAPDSDDAHAQTPLNNNN